MKKLSSDEIEGAAVKHLDKAGAYGIQEEEDAFVTILEGDKDNVVGLPMRKLIELLKKLGIRLDLLE
jgi:septum formation protein